MAEIIAIHLEEDLSEFTSTVTDSGDLSWANDATAQAVADTAGAMKLILDDATAIYGAYQLDSPYSTTGIFRARFYIDPNSLTMANVDKFILFSLSSTALQGSIAYISLYYTTATQYQIQVTIQNDAGSFTSSGYYAITDTPHYIEIQVLRATNSTSNDGSIQLWIDGTSKETISGIDNYDKFDNFGNLKIGALSGIDPGTYGTFYLDELIVNDDGSEIGPLVIINSKNQNNFISSVLKYRNRK